MGQADQDQVLDGEMAAFPPPEEPDWHAHDAHDAGEPARETAGDPARETADLNDPPGVGIDPSTGSLAGGTIQDQTRQALTNCEAILQAGGASLDDVIEVGILLTNPADFAGLNEEYTRWFPSGPPTRYVAKLGVDLPGLLVSIRMTAFIT